MANINSQSTKTIAGRIAEAVDADEKSEGCDLSAGMFGKHLSDLVIDIATLLDNVRGMAGHIRANDEYGDCDAELDQLEELIGRIEGE